MARCLLALGSNLGDRQAILSQACAKLAILPSCQLLARSRWYKTSPIGGASRQSEYLNGAVLLETSLATLKLATALRQTENLLGRQRVVRWDARTLDIDMLLYDSEIIETEEWTVPHPRMAFRNFVLEPAAEIAGAMLHPTTGWTIARLLAHLRNSSRFVVVTSNKEHAAGRLVSHLSASLGCPVWLDAEKILIAASGSQTGSGVEFPTNRSSGPPVLAELSPKTIEILAKSLLHQYDFFRPALVIAIDDPESGTLSVSTNRRSLPGLGPVARIPATNLATTNLATTNLATIVQESEAALRCIWPDLA